MKKGILVACAVFCMTTVGAFAAGPSGMSALGVYGTLGNASGEMGSGVGLSLKFGSFPVVGLQYNFDAELLNASCDYYVLDAESLASHLTYFAGLGGYLGICTAGEGADFDGGARLLAGLQFWPINKLELYLAPVLSIPLFPAPDVAFGAELGVRMHF